MILSQEDNSSPALMSRAFSLLKIPTLAKFGDSECEELRIRKNHSKGCFLIPILSKK